MRAGMIADATTSAEALVDAALVPVLTPADAAVPATGSRYVVLAGAVERQVLADGTVRAVTIWAGDGTILFADDVSLVGDEMRSMRTTVLSVIGDEPRSDVFHGLVRSFVPVELATGVSVAVELDRSADPIASAADPWRLLALLAGAGALLSSLLLARTFTRYGRRVEGFDEDVLRAAVAGHRRAEIARVEAESRRDAIAAELERTREALLEVGQRAREAARTADDTPRLREHLVITAEDLKRAEQERDALRQRLVEAGRAVETEAARGREGLASALVEIEQLEGVKLSLQDRAAKAEETVGELTKQVADLSARPDIEAELVSARREVQASRQDLAAARERAEQAERRGVELEDTVDELHTRLRDLERRPDLSAQLDAASAALDNAREQIHALSARAGAADAEATKLRTELERRQDARSKELEEATAALAETRADLESVGSELRSITAENSSLRDEAESLRSESDAAGQMIAAAKTELQQTTEHAKTLAARAKEVEAALEREQARAEAKAEEAQLARRQAEDLRAALERTKTDLPAARATAEARFTRFTEAIGAEGPVTVSAGPDGFAVEVQPEPPRVTAVNGSKHPGRGVAKVEVDTLVRRMVQESWSDRGRMVSVYAEPAVVEAEAGTIESIVAGLLERSVARTAEGNRIVLHVERAEDGVMLSVEDGRPPDGQAVSHETRRLAAELGGWANVEEHLGGGAIVRVFLPRSASAGAGALPA